MFQFNKTEYGLPSSRDTDGKGYPIVTSVDNVSVADRFNFTTDWVRFVLFRGLLLHPFKGPRKLNSYKGVHDDT